MISLILASKNGAGTLPELLGSLGRLVEPSCGWEVVVVDNGSDDDTAALLREWQRRLPLIVLHESRPGKNVSLNRALSVVKGTLVVMTDDDVVLPENFLVAYEQVAAEEPGHDIFGGHIVALWEREPSVQLLTEIPLDIAFAVTVGERERGPIKAGRLYGPNLAVRRQVFDSGLSFNEGVGPNGRRYVMGSETEFLQRAERAGHHAFFEPGITVEHRVDALQLEPSWLASRAARAGSTMLHQARRTGTTVDEVATMFGYPRWAVVQYVETRLALAFKRLRSGSDGELATLWRGSFVRGYAIEYRRLRREELSSSREK